MPGRTAQSETSSRFINSEATARVHEAHEYDSHSVHEERYFDGRPCSSRRVAPRDHCRNYYLELLLAAQITVGPPRVDTLRAFFITVD